VGERTWLMDLLIVAPAINLGESLITALVEGDSFGFSEGLEGVFYGIGGDCCPSGEHLAFEYLGVTGRHT